MEQIEERLSVPSDQSSFEGFGQTANLQGQGSPHSSSLADFAFLHCPEEQCHPLDSSLETSSLPSSPREEGLQLLLREPQPSRLDFLKFALSKEDMPDVLASRLTSSVRPPTLRQYESYWKKWLAFIRLRQPAKVSEVLVLEFLEHLFSVHRIAPTSILGYRCALKEPLRLFGIDFSHPWFAQLSKSQALERPAVRMPAVSWSLNRVLVHLRTIQDDSPIRLFLAKTLFLVTLTTGARVNEVAAFLRDANSLRINADGVLILTHPPDFLAKNEDPLRRRRPAVIAPLPSEPTLCPVESVRKYLDRTRGCSGALFRNATSGAPITLFQTRSALVDLIFASQPERFSDAMPRAHQIRAYASSLAFYHSMSFADISTFTGWEGPRVFFRHYLRDVEATQARCVVMGRVVGEAARGNDLSPLDA